jgi:glycosyltransferase involved in cell wall biosynthesis
VELKRAGRFVVGYVGRLEPGKNVDTLLRAIALLPGVHIQGVIVGEGTLRRDLERTAVQLGIGDRTHFFGYRSDRLSFLTDLDVFVLPSASEGIPRCLMEAMACGVVSAATDIPGCRDLVSDGKSGRLFREDDPAALAAIIEQFRTDINLRRSLAAAGRAFVRSHYSADRMAWQYEQLFGRLAGVDVVPAVRAVQ